MKPMENWTGPLLEHLIPSQVGSSFTEFHGGGFRVFAWGSSNRLQHHVGNYLGSSTLTLKPRPTRHELVFDTSCPAALDLIS